MLREAEILFKQGAKGIDLSLKKWNDILNGKDLKSYGQRCGLCLQFRDHCFECPAKGCMNSPFNEIDDYMEEHTNDLFEPESSFDEKKFKQLVRKELKFLEKIKKGLEAEK